MVRVPSALRESAKGAWDKKVVALSDVVLSAEGSVADIHALETHRLGCYDQSAYDRFDKTLGIACAAWHSEAVASHLGPSRRHDRHERLHSPHKFRPTRNPPNF